MRRFLRLAAATAALAALGGVPAAHAVERGPYSLEILVGGVPLSEHRARGTVYVEATAGREYAVRLRNGTPRRVAVALSIDGLNSIDAKTTTARDARKWILGPYETITLQGWQTSRASARRFVFTTEARSYGAWLGRTADLGIVSAAFFPERLPLRFAQEPSCEAGTRRRDAPSSRAAAGKVEAPEDYAATGIGREVDHRVREVAFDAQPDPAASIDVRYEFHDALVRLGVLPSLGGPLERREHARGFSGDRFAPDPYPRKR